MAPPPPESRFSTASRVNDGVVEVVGGDHARRHLACEQRRRAWSPCRLLCKGRPDLLLRLLSDGRVTSSSVAADKWKSPCHPPASPAVTRGIEVEGPPPPFQSPEGRSGALHLLRSPLTVLVRQACPRTGAVNDWRPGGGNAGKSRPVEVTGDGRVREGTSIWTDPFKPPPR